MKLYVQNGKLLAGPYPGFLRGCCCDGREFGDYRVSQIGASTGIELVAYAEDPEKDDWDKRGTHVPEIGCNTTDCGSASVYSHPPGWISYDALGYEAAALQALAQTIILFNGATIAGDAVGPLYSDEDQGSWGHVLEFRRGLGACDEYGWDLLGHYYEETWKCYLRVSCRVTME